MILLCSMENEFSLIKLFIVAQSVSTKTQNMLTENI